MASITKSPKSQYWIANFRDETQKRKNRSTKIPNTERNRSKAQRIAEEFEAVAKGTRSALHLKETFSQLLRDTGLTNINELPSCSFAEYAERFIERKSTDVGASSISSYKVAVKDFSTWLGDRSGVMMDMISLDELRLFRKHLLENFAPKTATRKLKAIKAIFAEAHGDGYILANPAHRLKMTADNNKQSGEGKRIFTIDEIRLLIKNASDEWRSMVIFGLYTGQRLGDLATLRWSNLNLEQNIFSIYTNKTGRKIDIPFSDTLLDHILTLDAPDDPTAFVHPVLASSYEKGGAPRISNQFSNLLADCGMREPVSHDSKGIGRQGQRTINSLSFHSLRATAVTLLHEAGIPQAMVQDWVGHSSKDVHRTYIKLGVEASKKASNALPKL